MSTANQALPSATLTEKSPGIAFAATGTEEVCVVMGPASKGTYEPRLIGASDLDTIKATYGCGPMVKEAAYGAGKVAQNLLMMRLLKAATPGVVHDVAVDRDNASDFTYTTTGVITDGADGVIEFVANVGPVTTGTSGITYRVSLDGGVTFGATSPLSTATSITVLGTVFALGSAKVVTPGDKITWWQTPPSGTLLTQTTVYAGGTTGTLTLSGTPEDAYEVIFEVITGFTVGTAGGVVRYSLDGGETYSADQRVGTATSIQLLDGAEDSGLDVALGAGALTAGDKVSAACSSPTYSASGLTDAINGTSPTTGLKNYNGVYTWLRIVGPVAATIAATADSLVTGLGSTRKRYVWSVTDARDRVSGEALAAWETRVAAEYESYTSTHNGLSGGCARVTCPITGRHNRAPAMRALMPRAMALPIQTDWAQYDLGPLPADVDITDANGIDVEHNAFTSPTLNSMGFITLRSWVGTTGVFPTKAALPGPDNDIKRVPLRRVMNVAKTLYDTILRLPVCKEFVVLKNDQPKWKKKKGDIYPPSLNAMNTAAKAILDAGLKSTGYVSDYEFAFNATPISLGGVSYMLTSKVGLYSLIYVDKSTGEIQFVSAQLSGATGA